jgi:hypothetical protein
MPFNGNLQATAYSVVSRETPSPPTTDCVAKLEGEHQTIIENIVVAGTYYNMVGMPSMRQ